MNRYQKVISVIEENIRQKNIVAEKLAEVNLARETEKRINTFNYLKEDIRATCIALKVDYSSPKLSCTSAGLISTRIRERVPSTETINDISKEFGAFLTDYNTKIVAEFDRLYKELTTLTAQNQSDKTL